MDELSDDGYVKVLIIPDFVVTNFSPIFFFYISQFEVN